MAPICTSGQEVLKHPLYHAGAGKRKVKEGGMDGNRSGKRTRTRARALGKLEANIVDLLDSD